MKTCKYCGSKRVSNIMGYDCDMTLVNNKVIYNESDISKSSMKDFNIEVSLCFECERVFLFGDQTDFHFNVDE